MPELDLPADEAAALQLALAIADGTPVDWANVSGASPDGLPGWCAPSLEQIDRIIEGHRALYAEEPALDDSAVVDTLLTEARRTSESPDALQVDWGPLVVREKVGRGSFGDVYRAWDPNLEREVALKLVPATTTTEAVSGAFEEGRLLARVRHPNVVTVYGVEQVEGRVGIWMEFIRGQTLADEISSRGPIGPEEAARIGVDVCQALSAVHEAGLLHRDVKAQNVMRDADGRVVLGDFGTGVRAAEHASSEPVVAGTPLYLAPEACRGELPTIQSDLYSVGVLLYFLVTGRHPVSGRTLREVREAHAAGRHMPLREARPDLPIGFVTVVDRLLDPSADRRPATPADVESLLGDWLQRGSDIHATVSDSTGSAEPRPTLTRIPRSALWLSVAATAGIAVVALTVWNAQSRRQSIGAGGRSPTGEMTAGFALAPVTRQLPDAPCSGAPSADGRWIACREDRPQGAGARDSPLVLFSPETLEQQVLVQPPQDERVSGAVISPAGDRVVYLLKAPDRPVEIRHHQLADNSDRSLAFLPPDASDLQLGQWAASDGFIGGWLWRHDGTEAFVLLSPETGAIETAIELTAPWTSFWRSPDGRFLALDVLEATDRAERDIQVCDLASDRCSVLAHPANDFYPHWAPDGRLFFNSDRGGTIGLWAVEMNGLAARAIPVLLRDMGRTTVLPYGFTTEGTLFHDLKTGEFDIYSVDLDATTDSAAIQVRLSPRAADINASPTWSPDGQWLAYVSQRGPFTERGAVRVVVQSMADGTERAFPYDISLSPTRLEWSPDASRIALRGRMGSGPERVFGVHLLDVQSGRVVKTLERFQPPEEYVHQQISDIGWVDGTTVVFSSYGGIGGFNTSTGREYPIWTAPVDQKVYQMAVSSDRLWIGFSVVNEDEPSATTMVIPSVGGVAQELLHTTAEALGFVEDWTADGRALLVTTADHSTRTPGPLLSYRLWQVPTDGSQPTQLPLEQPNMGRVSAHPNGRTIAFQSGHPEYQFWMTSGLQ